MLAAFSSAGILPAIFEFEKDGAGGAPALPKLSMQEKFLKIRPPLKRGRSGTRREISVTMRQRGVSRDITLERNRNGNREETGYAK
jgi:hypothetical protein